MSPLRGFPQNANPSLYHYIELRCQCDDDVNDDGDADGDDAADADDDDHTDDGDDVVVDDDGDADADDDVGAQAQIGDDGCIGREQSEHLRGCR